MITDNYKIPNSTINTITRNAPTHYISENRLRRSGQYGGYEDEGAGYKTIIIYVQSGLAEEMNVFKAISKAIFQFQIQNGRKYQVFIFGFGQTPVLQHEKKFFPLGEFIGEEGNFSKIAATIAKISGHSVVTQAHIPEIFPPKDFTSLYGYNKTQIDREDLLIIIGRQGQVFLNPDLEQQMTSKLYKQTLFAEISNDKVNYLYQYKDLNYNLNPEKKKTIDQAVFNGIRKTVNRFREKPFFYFTEADIHASLSKDIMEGNGDVLVTGGTIKDREFYKTPVSLVHHEYPTNFRYKKDELLNGYENREDITFIDSSSGDRGNYDLAILNPEFVGKMFSQNSQNLIEIIKHIINKEIGKAIGRSTFEELLFAIEVKFVHLFNARNIQMLDEVKKDNEKLRLAVHHKHCQKAINLVFCSSEEMQRSDKDDSVIKQIREYIKDFENDKIVNVFIESYINSDDENKHTPRPTCSKNNSDWVKELKDILKSKN